MDTLIYLIPFFFVISIIYSSIGFGGGSSYVAIMALFAFPYTQIPKVSLLCNIIVVIGGCYFYYKAGHLKISKALPFILGSIPLSYIGGKLIIAREFFLFLLAISLIVAALNLLFFNPKNSIKNYTLHIKNKNQIKINNMQFNTNLINSTIIGGILGLMSGLVGIGGGIFLSPILFLKRWGYAKEIAATSSFFILVNSVVGLIGQFSKANFMAGYELQFILPLVITVFLGGQIGSRISVFKLSDVIVKKTTAVVVLSVGIRILVKLSFVS